MLMEPHRLALPVGFQIENFRIEAVLGKGGFGITYLAVDLHLGKRVAIKELLPDTIATRIDGMTVAPHSAGMQENWEWARGRFLEEARTLASFSHPAIVGVHRLIEANGTAYMAMDYVEGESYEARLQRIGTEPDEASLMQVFTPVLSGLAEVHARGLLHRDVKPENILIDRRGQAVLADFGSAREAVGKTVTMTSIVTHGYSPLEQYQSKGKMGPWTDIYATSAVMYRAVTGNKPPVAVERIEKDEYKPLASFNDLSRFTAELKTAVDKGLRVKAVERPQTIGVWNVPFGAPVAQASAKQPRLQNSDASFPFSWGMAVPVGLLGLLLVFAVGVVAGGKREARNSMTKAEESLKHEKLQVEAQAADAVAAARKKEAEALYRVQSLENSKSAVEDAWVREKAKLEQENQSLEAKVAQVTSQLAALETSLAEKKAESDRREKAKRQEEQQRAQIMQNNLNSITTGEAFSMNQQALTAAGRPSMRLSSSITPEAIRLGQTAQLIVLIKGPDIFSASAAGPPELPGLSVGNADIYKYQRTADLPRGSGMNREWSTTFAYQITAEQPGRFVVPSFAVQVDDIALQTFPVELQVSP